MKPLYLSTLLLLITACTQNSKVLYKSDQYTVFTDKVIQGANEADIVSPTKIVSNYKSLAYQNYSRLITFKFSINEKDNERPPLKDHWIIISNEHESPIIEFGQDDGLKPADPGTKLPPNYKYTFRLDMNPVLSQFKEKGYYETFDGTRIAKDDFKNVYIAGGSEPLSWDWVNLDNHGLALKDPNGDGIYELTVVLNPYDENAVDVKTWELTKDISSKPKYESNQKIVDALFNLSVEEALKNIEPDSTFRTGAKWGGVWTRDVSYSIFLAFAYHEPEVAKISLLRKVNKRGRIIQDTGSGGAWPVSSDRTIWANAAWELYKITGDKAWLKQAYEIIKNTLEDDYLTLKSATGMNKGESSFLDWREQTYPKWMSNVDIAESENLGTNVVHYRANIVLSEMAKILGEPYEVYEKRAAEIKKGINNYLWMNDEGYYAQYLYGRSSLMKSPRFEALGEALSIIFDVADTQQAKSIMEKSPVTPFGTTCIYPQIPGIPPYHNNAVWPFVQSYWNLAAAKAGNEKMLDYGLAAIYRAGALFLTNYENFVAQNGDYVGTEINSDRMLWSMAGNLAMVHRLFIGMNFEPDGIRFKPVIPQNYAGNKKLSNFHYRKSILEITVSGFGNQIDKISLDGLPLDEPFFPANLEGNHKIAIKMANKSMDLSPINLVENKFSLTNPKVTLAGDSLNWNEITGALLYHVYKDGKLWKPTKEATEKIEPGQFAEYAVTAIEADGLESFASEPVLMFNRDAEKIIEIEDVIKKSDLPYTNFSGKGFIKITQTQNREISIPVNCNEPGTYLLDFRYANGTGPWNTDNNCGIRSLYVNSGYQGVVIMPQRGVDEWSDWGFTNPVKIQLKKGQNKIILKFEDWNTNMDGELNEALLDYLRLIKMH